MAERFILCSNCGTKNRVPDKKVGRPICGNCQKQLSVGRFGDNNINIGNILLLVCGIGLAAFFYVRSEPGRHRQVASPTSDVVQLEVDPVFSSPGSTKKPKLKSIVQPEVQPVFISPGVIKKPKQKPVAPFGIVSSTGSNYYIKLVNLGGKTVMTAFVQGGQYFETLVPLGSYELKYAAGTTWYGERQLFGRNTVYSKASKSFEFTFDGTKFSGYTVELIMQANGNLHTQSISENDF
jgi:hypothetical protein